MRSSNQVIRRGVLKRLGQLALGVSLAVSHLAMAQAAPSSSPASVAGKDYQVLANVQPTESAKKIEVVEFFGYFCPHCFQFDPILESWVKKLPADVTFRRVHVLFRESMVNAQKTLFTLEAMNRMDVHSKVFQAIHVDKKRLDSAEEIADFVAVNGVDKKQFLDIFNSFAMTAKSTKAKQLQTGYQIEGVPALGINGKYLTSAAMTGSHEAALKTAEYLIEQERKKLK
jgi:thiol:disulfide interchange protein DsbA